MRILRMFSEKCEHAKKCPFYSSINCDHYYQVDRRCGIKREVDSGMSWEWIALHHKKREAEVI